MKKKILIISIILSVLIIAIISTIIYLIVTITPYYRVYANKYLVEKFKPDYQYIDENLNDWLRDNTFANKNIKEKNKNLKPFIPSEADLFKPESEKNLLDNIESIVPDNMEKIKSNLINYRITDWMKKHKKIDSSDSEENFTEYLIRPEYETIKETAIYWYFLSRYLEKTNDYQNSLTLSLGIFYLSRDWERGYCDEYIAINKALSRSLCRIGCRSILVWASKPKPQNFSLSKNYAKDILEYVKTESPASLNVKYERKQFEDILTSDVIKNRYKKESVILSSLKETNTYKNIIDEIYEKPLNFIDKPLYEINKEFDYYKENMNKLFKNQSSSTNIFPFIFNPEKNLTLHLINQRDHDFVSMKLSHEQKLAELEFTAIALAINAYVSQNNKMPNNMDELNKWFGEELPKNRLTNEPYVLDITGKHLLYNKGIDGIENLDSKDTDDIYFNLTM